MRVLLALLPKGADARDIGGYAVRIASNVRLASLESADAKLMASTMSHMLRNPTAANANRGQRVSIRGRDLIANIVELDVAARVLCLTSHPSDHPALLFTDIAAAFPVLSRVFVWAILRRIGLHPGFVSLIQCV